MLGGFLLAGLSAEAQTTEASKATKGKITVNIVKEIDGKITKIDTTFDLKDQDAISEFMERNQIEMKSQGPAERKLKVMKFKSDNGSGEDEKEIEITLPPMPPMPPTPPGAGEINTENMQAYTFRFSDEDISRQLEELESLMENNPAVSGKVKKEIRKFEFYNDGDKRKKSKKAKKRIIIIEEV